MARKEQIEEEATEWFVRLRDEPVAASTRSDFAAWRLADPAHGQAYAELEQLWGGLDELGDPTQLAGRSNTCARSRRGPAYRRSLAVAASLALALLAGYASLPDGGIPALLATNRTPRGELRSLRLADGSVAMMDAGTALSVDMDGPVRKAELVSGRAYFVVRHLPDRPFHVHSGGVEIVDVGTRFEVARSARRVSVSVEEGAVDISRPGAAPIRMGAGYGTEIGDDQVRPHLVTDVAAWRSHRLTFRGRSLASILDELGRYQSGWVLLRGREAGERRLTGSLDTRQPAAAVDALAQMAGLTVLRVGPLTILQSRR